MSIKVKKPKTFNRKYWIIANLRKISLRYPARIRAFNKAKHTYFIKAKNGNDVKRISFTCASCLKSGIASKDGHMDHKIPVATETEYPNVIEFFGHFVDRLFCDEDNWQWLCKDCHDKKTKLENEQRYFRKKNS